MVPRKILLDECVYKAHIPLFHSDFIVEHTASLGWAGTENGQLMRKARRAKFGMILTEDAGFFNERLDKISNIKVAIFIVASDTMIAENLPKVIPAISARMLDGLTRPLYVMGKPGDIHKVVSDLPHGTWEEVPPDYTSPKYLWGSTPRGVIS